jgi:rSAM/selenodomain-associated transferase 2/rSAM/selenodomain-associated transferase 1
LVSSLPRLPFLSIVIPVLDEAAGIADALTPLQPLRAEGVELIVVDGGSTDGTAAAAAPLCDRLLVALRGRGRQMHEGARAAQGEVIVFLHADTVLPAGAIDAIRRAVAAGAAWGRFDVSIDGRSPALRLVGFMMNLRSRLTGIATGDQAMFVTRAAYLAAGGFPDIPLMEDIAFSATLRRLGRPACLRERVVTSGRRWEKHGVLTTIARMWSLRLRYYFGVDPRQLAIDYGYRPREDTPLTPSTPADPVRIAILAKAPVPGYAKTRLIPALGPEGAAELQRRLIRHTVQTAREAALGPIVLWCAPDCSDPEFQALRAAYGVELQPQPDADLGARMLAAAAQAPVMATLVIGTDCPARQATDLRAAADALAAGNDVVLIPAEDGGYVLIGLSAPHDVPFSGVAWGTESVLAQTRQRLDAAGLRRAELPALWDLDRPEDLPRLAALHFDSGAPAAVS